MSQQTKKSIRFTKEHDALVDTLTDGNYNNAVRKVFNRYLAMCQHFNVDPYADNFEFIKQIEVHK